MGFIVAETGSRGNGHIITIDVLPQARGAGDRIAAASRRRGAVAASRCHSVILETAVDNHAGPVFLQAARYNVVKTLPRILFEWRGRLGAEERFAFAAAAS